MMDNPKCDKNSTACRQCQPVAGETSSGSPRVPVRRYPSRDYEKNCRRLAAMTRPEREAVAVRILRAAIEETRQRWGSIDIDDPHSWPADFRGRVIMCLDNDLERAPYWE